MRILHVISTLAPSSGGPTRVLKDLVSAQALVGHLVTIATTDRGNPVQEKLPQEYFTDLHSRDIDLQIFPVAYAPLLFSPQLGSWLRRSLTSFDIVHVHGLYRFPPTYAARQARRQGVPYVIRPHGALDPYLHDRSTSAKLHVKRLYERWFDMPNLHAAGAIHFTAEEERQRAGFLNLRAPSFVVPNGLDFGRYRDPPSRGALRTRWALGDAPVVLFLGRLHFKKGLDLLIPAFDTLRRRLPNVRLVIAGPENDNYGQKVRGWIQELGLAPAVHVIGPLQGADVVQAYVDADVFALPSYTENFGMTVTEAMACALPVVISDQVNIHAEVLRAGAGLVTRCDADEVAQALETLLHDPKRRRVMGEAGRRLVRERYTWPAIVETLMREYEAVIGHRGNRHRRALDPESSGTIAAGDAKRRRRMR